MEFSSIRFLVAFEKGDDSEVSDNSKEKGKSYFELIFNIETEEETEKYWKNNSSNIINKSTSSLHISASKNSFEYDASHIFVGKSNEDLKKKVLIQEKSFVFENPFEFPRQQNDKFVSEPKVSQFKASQRLLNPNETKYDDKKDVVQSVEHIKMGDSAAEKDYDRTKHKKEKKTKKHKKEKKSRHRSDSERSVSPKRKRYEESSKKNNDTDSDVLGFFKVLRSR